MDPIGFGLENFDAIGHFRTMDNGKPVDASGTLAGTDVDGDFVGPAALGKQLAGSTEARDCFSQHWFEYALGASADHETLKTVAHDFIAGNRSVKDLIVAIIRADTFIMRTKG
jgi:hypothetical protein